MPDWFDANQDVWQAAAAPPVDRSAWASSQGPMNTPPVIGPNLADAGQLPPSGPLVANTSMAAPSGGGQQPFNYDAFRTRAEELSRGSSGTNAEFIQRIYPQLAQEFGGIERFGSKGDKIRLPTGEVIDAVISAGVGGRGYNWGIEQPGGHGGGAPAGPVSGMGDLGWSPLGPSGAGGSSGISAGSYSATPLTAAKDYTPTETQGPDKLTLGTITQPGAVTADQVRGPEALTARNVADPTGFKNLSAADLQTDPSYQFRLKQGLGAMQNSAAAKGLLRTGGTLKALGDYAGESASQEYQAANERARTTYQQNLSNQSNIIGQNNAAQAQAYGLTNQFQQGAQIANQNANLQAGQFNAGMNFNTQAANIANQLAAYQAYQGLNQQNRMFNASRYDQAAQNNFANRFTVENANNANALNAYNANVNAQLGAGSLANQAAANANAYNLGLGNLSLGNKQADQSYNLGLGGQQLGWANFGLNQDAQSFNQGLQTFNTNYGVYRDNRDTAFNQNYALANLGAGAAGGYANAAGNYYGNQGAANANGRMAGAGAWSGALGTLGNLAQQGAYWQATQPGGYGGLYLDPSQGQRVGD